MDTTKNLAFAICEYLQKSVDDKLVADEHAESLQGIAVVSHLI
jgi:hypothetical protein